MPGRGTSRECSVGVDEFDNKVGPAQYWLYGDGEPRRAEQYFQVLRLLMAGQKIAGPRTAAPSVRTAGMNELETTTLWLGAFRYYVGRMTYAVSDFCDMLIANWETLPESTRKLIQRDLEEEFVRDIEARDRGSEHLPLGHDCDRKQWERVRALWRATAGPEF